MDYFDQYDEFLGDSSREDRTPDVVEQQAVDALRAFFAENRDQVFSSRQVEVLFEDRYFHWVTHRALKVLADEGAIVIEQRMLGYGSPANFVWDRRNRYTRRQVAEVQSLVEQYSDADFTAGLGNTGELLVSDGFARFGFQQVGRNAREYRGQQWVKSDHNLDFIFERDGLAYGVEVKNTLPYINDKELAIKLDMCDQFGVRPIFVVRAMPRIWIVDVDKRGGFTLMLKHQLYPVSHKALANRVKAELKLPVDAPRALYDGTMQRLLNWHERNVAGGADSKRN